MSAIRQTARRSAVRRRLAAPEAVAGLGALAQVTRLAAYRALVQAGPGGVAAGVLARELGVAPASLSFHLSQLAAAGLVRGRQQGRHVFYAADYGTMNALVEFLTENCCGGNACGPRPGASPCTPKEMTP